MVVTPRDRDHPPIRYFDHFCRKFGDRILYLYLILKSLPGASIYRAGSLPLFKAYEQEI